jgi:hypothetical protein
LFLAAAGKGQQNQGVIGGDIDQAVAGELFQHALAGAVVALADALGKGAQGVVGRLLRLAVDGEDLAELDEVVGLGTAEGAETELGNDFANAEAGPVARSAALPARGRKRVGGRRRTLFEGLAGKNAGAFCS